ncbi:unnamed protein product [Caenorhabditis nigoni]
MSLIVIIHYPFITASKDLILTFMCATQDEKIQTCVHTCIQVVLSQKRVVHIFIFFDFAKSFQSMSFNKRLATDVLYISRTV